MEERIKIVNGGIKCDNCDYQDLSITIEQTKDFLNKSCPKCGENLLTDKIY